MATLRPSIRPNRSRSVRMSSSPWVGCSCLPSPALMTLERMRWPRNCAAPDAPWRITTMSIRIASRLRAVSTRVSPLETDEPARGHVHRVGGEPLLGELERDPGPGRGLEEEVDDGLAAERRHLLDRPLAHFLERLRGVEDEPDLVGAQRLEPDQVLAEARRGHLRPPHQLDRVAAVELGDEHIHPVAGAGAHRGAHDVGLDRQLAAAAVDEHAEQDPPRPAEVGALVERGADGAAGIEHVVDDDHGACRRGWAAGSRPRRAAARWSGDRRDRA